MCRNEVVLRGIWRLAIVLSWMQLIVFESNGQTAATYHARADQAIESFLLKFWKGPSQYLRNAYPDDGSLTGYWTFSQGWQAVMDGVERTGGQKYYGFIESLYLGQDSRGWTNSYYDDECWMTVALIRAYDLTHDVIYLNRATGLFADIMGGWNTTCCGTTAGGLWWDKSHTQKATAANAGAALAGAQLYLKTGNSTYLSFAQQVYAFWYANMVDPTTHQVCDHINPDGTKVWWRFTYNEGLMIGASVALFKATGDSSYYAKASAIASYMIANEVVGTTYGPALFDGSNSGCGGDCHQFKGPAYRYLMDLYNLNTNATQYARVLKASADAIWNSARNTNWTAFSINWAGPVQTNFDLAQDNAACTALNLYAEQAGPYPGTGLPANVYQAEDAVLHSLSVEAIYGTFGGWGYVAGWNSASQALDFQIRTASAGKYTLGFRYSAGAGNASRRVVLDGTTVSSNLQFSNTGGWPTYSNVYLSVTLPAGFSTVSVKLDPANGNQNYLNLDSMAVISEQIVFAPIAWAGPASVQLSWSSVPGRAYQLLSSDGFPLGSWTNRGLPTTATSTNVSVVEVVDPAVHRFYRVLGN